MSVWPAISFISLMAIDLGINIARNGERRAGTYSVGSQIFGACIVLPILYYGGFFASLGWSP